MSENLDRVKYLSLREMRESYVRDLSMYFCSWNQITPLIRNRVARAKSIFLVSRVSSWRHEVTLNENRRVTPGDAKKIDSSLGMEEREREKEGERVIVGLVQKARDWWRSLFNEKRRRTLINSTRGTTFKINSNPLPSSGRDDYRIIVPFGHSFRDAADGFFHRPIALVAISAEFIPRKVAERLMPFD